MRKWIMGIALAASMTGVAWAQGTEIEWVISDQLEAFKADNFARAFEFASPNVPTQASDEFPTTWTLRYPLNWIVITEIHND